MLLVIVHQREYTRPRPSANVNVEFTAEHILTKSVYFFDPDGNRLEIFCEMMDPETGMEHMRQGVNLNNRSYTPEPILSA